VYIGLDKEKDRDGWLVDYVTITTEKSAVAHFVIYDIVMDEIAARTGEGILHCFSILLCFYKPNHTFHYTRRIMPKRVTSLRCPSPRHSAKATQVLASMLITA